MGNFLGAGINVSADGQYDVALLNALGARSVRFVLHPAYDVRWYLEALRASQIGAVLVAARESFGGFANWDDAFRHYANLYRDYNPLIQCGNEPDHESESSWTLAGTDINRLHDAAHAAFGENATYIGPGLVSGDAAWIERSGFSALRFAAVAVHPYAKEPNTPALFSMLAEYRARLAYQTQALIATEYHARTPGMTKFLNEWLDGALAFCISDAMVPGFGLLEDINALRDFEAYTRPAMTDTPKFVYGFQQWAMLEPGLIGAPLENEYGPWQCVTSQRTTRGWLNAVNTPTDGWLFWFTGDDKRRHRWLPTWPQSEEITYLERPGA